MWRAVLLAAMLLAPVVARGQAAAAGTEAPLPTSEQEVQEQLKTFDPEAVAAARHYFENPAMKRASLAKMEGALKAITVETAKVLQQSGKGGDNDSIAKLEAENARVLASAGKAATGSYAFITDLQTITALRTFSKDELIALDAFYSSSAGQSILAKMPMLSRRMPEVMHIVMPRLMAVMNDDLTSHGEHKP